MTSPTRAARARGVSLVLVALLAAGCGSGPQSQASAFVGPSTAPESVAPESSAPVSPEPASEPPSEAAVTAGPTEAPAAPAIPPKPAKVTWKHVGSKALAGGTTRESYRITWTAPDGVATTFTIYGVTECLRYAKQYDGKPCVVKGMKIPKRTLKLIAQVPGSARTVDVAWKEGESGPGPYAAVLIRASNAAGDSIFTIVWSTTVCWQCTY